MVKIFEGAERDNELYVKLIPGKKEGRVVVAIVDANGNVKEKGKILSISKKGVKFLSDVPSTYGIAVEDGCVVCR